jgi:hypothetical protein
MLRLGRLLTYILPLLTVCLGVPSDLQTRWYFPPSIDLLSVTIRDLQLLLSNGTITSVQLTQRYLVRHKLYRADPRTT